MICPDLLRGYVHPSDIARRVPPAHKLLYIQKPFNSQEVFQFALSLSMKWRAECELMEYKSSLEKVNREIIETNKALSVLARNIDRDKKLLEKKIYETTRINIIPIIKELQGDKNCQKCVPPPHHPRTRSHAPDPSERGNSSGCL